jgi:hypothetical protein
MVLLEETDDKPLHGDGNSDLFPFRRELTQANISCTAQAPEPMPAATVF